MSQRDDEEPDPTVDHRPSDAIAQGEHGNDAALTPTEAESPANRDTANENRGLPQKYGRYRIKKKFGQGGMGSVYLARDEKLHRAVAIKVPSFRAQEDKVVIERFYREARAAATLDHPNLCPVYDVGVIDGIHYLSMAHIDGKPLTSFRKRGGLPTRQVAALIRTIALALHEAHQKGVIHRDLKPANIMVNRRRQPVVMDFGLAQREHVDSKLTQTGTIVGTPSYMSPGSRTYDEADYRQNIRNLASNARPVYVDAFRLGNSLHYPVCWSHDNDKIPDWTVERTEGIAAFDDLVLRMRRQNYRPICFAVVR